MIHTELRMQGPGGATPSQVVRRRPGTAHGPRRPFGTGAAVAVFCVFVANTAGAADAATARGDRANADEGNKTSAAACGDIQVRSDLKCSLEAKGSCTAKCSQGARFSVACEASCAGRCSQSPEDGCRTECLGTCASDCASVKIDCDVHCNAGCDADCESTCDGDETCRTKCEASCTGQCTAKCAAPSTDTCADLCGASCEGICAARANRQCEVGCDARCRTDLKGKCEVSCTDAKAALFCDGQFISVSTDDVKRCVDYLSVSGIEAKISVDVDCSGNTCTGTAAGKTATVTTSKCSVTSGHLGRGGSGDPGSNVASLGLLAAVAVVLRRIKNEKRAS